MSEMNDRAELIRNLPASSLTTITPSDDTELSDVRALYVGGSGNVAVIALNDSAAVTLTNIAAGSIIPVQAIKVMATNTTATNIVAMK